MCAANDRRRYNVTSSLIGWAHTQHDPCVYAINRTILHKRTWLVCIPQFKCGYTGKEVTAVTFFPAWYCQVIMTTTPYCCCRNYTQYSDAINSAFVSQVDAALALISVNNNRWRHDWRRDMRMLPTFLYKGTVLQNFHIFLPWRSGFANSRVAVDLRHHDAYVM